MTEQLDKAVVDISTRDYICSADLCGVTNVFDAGSLWTAARWARSRQQGVTLEQALRDNPRTPGNEPDLVETYFGHIRVYIPTHPYVYDQTVQRGVGIKALRTRLTELHRQKFGRLLGEGGRTRIEIQHADDLEQGHVRFEFGPALFLPDKDARPRQTVEMHYNDEASVTIGYLYPGQDMVLLSGLAAAVPETSHNWPYDADEALVLLSQAAETKTAPQLFSVPLYRLGVELVGRDDSGWRYLIHHPDHPDAVLHVSHAVMTRKAPDSPFKDNHEELSDAELMQALEALSDRRKHHTESGPGVVPPVGSKPINPGNKTVDFGDIHEGVPGLAGDDEWGFGDLDSVVIEPDHWDKPMGVNMSPTPQQPVATEHAVGSVGLALAGVLVPRVSALGDAGGEVLRIMLGRLSAANGEQAIVVNANDDMVLFADGVESPLDLSVRRALPGGLYWLPVPSVAAGAYLGWIMLSEPHDLDVPKKSMLQLGRAEDMDVHPGQSIAADCFVWEGETDSAPRLDKFNFSRHQLDLHSIDAGLGVRMRGDAPAYVVTSEGKVRDILRLDGQEETVLHPGDYLFTGSYVLTGKALSDSATVS